MRNSPSLMLSLMLVICWAIASGGCDWTGTQAKADQAGQAMQQAGDAAKPVIEKTGTAAATLIDKLDTATGQKITDDRLAKIEAGLEQVNNALAKGIAVTEKGASIDGPQKEASAGLESLLTAIATATGIGYGLVQTLRAKRAAAAQAEAEATAKTAQKANTQLIVGIEGVKNSVAGDDPAARASINQILRAEQDQDVAAAVKAVKTELAVQEAKAAA